MMVLAKTTDGVPGRPLVARARSVSKRYGATQALTDVSLDIFAGSITAVVGENGAGKSTLMNILSGLVEPSSGKIEISGAEVRRFIPTEFMNRHKVALIPQELSLVMDRSVAHNVMLGREPGGIFPSRGEMRATTRQILGRLGSSLNPDVLAGSLNVATQQLVVLARGLSRECNLLILDEPTAVLSPIESEQLFHVIRSLRDEGIAIVYVSHRMPEIFSLSDRIVVLRNGKIVDNRSTADVGPDDVVTAMVGRQLEQQLNQIAFPVPKASPAAISISKLSGEHFRDISLSVANGEVLGLAGLPDSGKSDLLQSIFGASRIREGSIEIDGSTVKLRSPSAAIRAGLAYLPSERRTQGIFPNLTVADNASVLIQSQFSFAGILYKRRLHKAAVALAEKIKVKFANPRQLISSLSGGNQQKTLLARSMSTNPTVVLLDEPTRGIDVGAKAEVYNLINELTGAGVAVLLSSSDLQELLSVCRRIAVMAGGDLVGVLDTAEATEDRVISMATGAHRMNHDVNGANQ